MIRALSILVALCAVARADRPLHGSIGGGTMLLATGAQGDHNRFELEADVEPYHRFGALVAWRGFDDGHHGIVAAGVVYEAGAARPRLVVDLHGDAGVDLDQRAPVLGGGIRTTITAFGPLGIALDAGPYLVIGGIDTTRLVLAASAALVLRI